MTFKAFLARVVHKHIEHLRCVVSPSPELLNLMEEVGLEKYEKYVSRMEKENLFTHGYYRGAE